MINKFINETDKEYGVFCEDDIYLDKELANDIPRLVEDFKALNLDVLLLGYLTKYKIETWFGEYGVKQLHSEQQIKIHERNYHNYPNHLWGGQMYMLSRTHAKNLLDKYYYDYAEKSLNAELQLTPFCSDWTITKDGNRAIVYPMYAVEDGKTHYEDGGQNNFHKDCFYCNYDPTQFI
jgi:hypothetical protein